MPDTYAFAYEEGTLILGVVEPESRRLLWRGAATDEVNFSSTPEAMTEQINQAVRRMLERFPSRPAR